MTDGNTGVTKKAKREDCYRKIKKKKRKQSKQEQKVDLGASLLKKNKEICASVMWKKMHGNIFCVFRLHFGLI